MKYFKLICVAMLLAFFRPTAFADEQTYTGLAIDYADGSRYVVNLEPNMRLVCPDNYSISLCADTYDVEAGGVQLKTYVTVDYDKFKSIELTNEPAGIEQLKADMFIDFRYRENMISLSRVSAPATVCIYDAAGALVLTRKITSDYDIDFSGHPAGVYVLTINDKSFKFLAK